MPASPQIIDSAISMFARAAEANSSTPARRGNLIVLSAEEAGEVMITADLHGHRINYNRLLEIADLDAHPRRHLITQEVCHGGPTYPGSTGCMSHLMLEDVARLKTRYPDRVHHLLSNHELAELTDYPIVKARKMLNLAFRSGMQEMYGEATERVRAAAMSFIRTCPLAVRMTTGIFVCHSTPEAIEQDAFDLGVFDRPLRNEDLRDKGPAFRLVWGRDFRPANAAAFARLVNARVLIHGHEPAPHGYLTPNPTQIILDSCTGRAAYLVVPLDQPLTQRELVERIEFL